ncbi:helix-turn-helix domain-containing protein [Streptomyces sp. NPDC020379]|uniref:MmyB family transcriptional regulator n=1 Tax=Streptomyces sp. NPDC020379 TaxID=3365071 RepID=UPI00379DA3AF
MNREALGELLRARRAQLNPEDFGLRRARGGGLTQTQVDQLLFQSQGTYQRLENGKHPNPPEHLLCSVAKLLGLNEHEWFVLWHYAKAVDRPYPLHPTSGMEIPATWADAIQEMGVMAYVNDPSWNVVTSNAAWKDLFPRGETPHNVMEWMLLNEEARTRVLIGWEQYWAPHVIGQFRLALAALPDDPTLRQIERRALDHPIVGPVYRRAPHTIPAVDGAQRPLHHATLGPGWTTVLASEPLSSPRSRLIVLVHKTQEGPPPSLWAPSLSSLT